MLEYTSPAMCEASGATTRPRERPGVHRIARQAASVNQEAVFLMARLVRTETYPGKTKHFRNNMERILVLQHGKWTSSNGECLVIRERRKRELVTVTQEFPSYEKLAFPPREHYRDSTPEDRSTWLIKKEGGEECAAIEVYQQPDEHSSVDFLDGYDPDWPEVSPIGPLFEEFCDWVVAQVWPEAIGREDTEKRRTGAPRLEDRNDVEEKRAKARDYQERVEKGTPKEIAAQLVGHSRKTLERWVKRLL